MSLAVEDGSELTTQAWRLLESEGKDLGLPNLLVQPLPTFLLEAEKTHGPLDRQAILDQALLIFDHLYPHMPFKTDIYQLTHPSDYIRSQIIPGLDALSEIEFHARLITAFSLVRDAHTLYGLPSPYRGGVAFLPFQLVPYLDRKAGWRLIVASVMDSEPKGGFGHPYFGSGAEIVAWGDLDTLAHLQRIEADLPGGNFFASLARGAMHSTIRPLIYIHLPFPDELPDAILHYRAPNSDQVRTIRLPWGVATGFGATGGFSGSAFSVSPATAITRSCSKFLHHREQLRSDGHAARTLDPMEISSLPEVFDFQYTGGLRTKGYINLSDLTDSAQPNARFGYIRIKAFRDAGVAPGATDRIVDEFRRIVAILDQKAPDGLIVDIRSNPGGDVQAAERMLQMLTARIIEPVRFHLANTPVVLDILRNLKISMAERLSASDSVKLAQALAELKLWLNDAEQPPLPSGSPLTPGRPLTDPDSANDIGQIYHGRGVVLLINSLTYSAADIFAAGFQDHKTGQLIGTSLVTGGGGGNVWNHEDLVNKVGPSPGIALASLPGDATMTLAIRRCTRVGDMDGEPVEDVGVEAELYFAESAEDVILGSPGILRRACESLRDAPVARIDAQDANVSQDGSVTVEVRTVNIASLKFVLDGRSALIMPIDGDAIRTCAVPAVQGVAVPSVLRIEGYSAPDANVAATPRLLRSRTLSLRPPVTLEAFDPATQSISGIDT